MLEVPRELGRLDGCMLRVEALGVYLGVLEFDGLVLEREPLGEGLVGLLRRGEPYVLIGFLTGMLGEYCLKRFGCVILLGRDGEEEVPSFVDDEFNDLLLIELGPIFDLDVAIRLGVLTTLGFPGDAADDAVLRLGVRGATVDGRIVLFVPLLPNGRGIKADFLLIFNEPFSGWADFSGIFFFAILRPLMALLESSFSDFSSVEFSSLLSFATVVLLTCCRLKTFSDEVALDGACSFGL